MNYTCDTYVDRTTFRKQVLYMHAQLPLPFLPKVLTNPFALDIVIFTRICIIHR
jgi:hypothetical protein